MFDTKAFGAHLQRKRKNANMTQLELAEKLKLTRQAVSMYETGESFPDISIVLMIADIFDTTVDELVYPTGIRALTSPNAKEVFLERLLAGEIELPLLEAALPHIEDMTQLIEAAVFEGALPQSVQVAINTYWLNKNHT